ncbi:unnamed protein product, partial [Medioppia subpectinata]
TIYISLTFSQRLGNTETFRAKEEPEDQSFVAKRIKLCANDEEDQELVTTSSLDDDLVPPLQALHHHQNQLLNSPLADTKSNTISSSPSASSDSGHCSRASPDITSLTTANGALQPMASASGESPTDYHNHWAMCGNDVKVDSTLLSSHALSDSDCNIYSTGVADHLNSSYAELSPTHPTSYPYYDRIDSMQAAYQSTYSTGSAAAAFAANYYPQTNPYGVMSQSYNGSRSISSQCKTSSSAALAAQAAYLNPSPFSTTFNNSNSQTAQNAYCYGYPSTFSNTGANSQLQTNCQQSSALDYPYAGFGHSTGYSPYYNTGYGSYIPNTTSNVNTSPSPASALTLSSAANSSTPNATYQLTQLSQQTDQNLSHYHHIDDCPSPIKAEIHQNASTGGAKKGTKGSGRRGRRPPNPSPEPENNLERVFVWDLDETIILYLSLLTKLDTSHHDCKCIHCIGSQLELLIERFAKNHFFLNDLRNCEQEHVDDAAAEDNGQDLSNYNFQSDGFAEEYSQPAIGVIGLNPCPIRGNNDSCRKMAFRYRRIKEVYSQYRENVSDLLSGPEREKLYDIQREWDVYTEGRTLKALKCLQLINSRPKCMNVLVTSLPLVESLAKVLIFGVAPNFAIENMYSSVKTGKDHTFQRIVNKFGKKCTYVAIGDGLEEKSAAQKLDIPFWEVTCTHNLDQLYNALSWGHL